MMPPPPPPIVHEVRGYLADTWTFPVHGRGDYVMVSEYREVYGAWHWIVTVEFSARGFVQMDHGMMFRVREHIGHRWTSVRTEVSR